MPTLECLLGNNCSKGPDGGVWKTQDIPMELALKFREKHMKFAHQATAAGNHQTYEASEAPSQQCPVMSYDDHLNVNYGVQGGNFANCNLQNTNINIHTSAKDSFSQNYQKSKLIGNGSFGEIWIVLPKNVSESNEFILKEITCTEENVKKGKNEIEILKNCLNARIVCYIEDFLEDSKIQIIMEYCEGGDLAKFIEEQKRFLPIDFITEWVIQLTSGLYFIHRKRIIHRDLRTANIFLTCDKKLKIGNFSFAKKLDDTSLLNISTRADNTYLYYMAPEIHEGDKYNTMADMWSLGIIVYEIITFKKPFDGHDWLQAISKGVYDLQVIDKISPFLATQVSSLLTTDPLNRPTAEEMLLRIKVDGNKTSGSSTLPAVREHSASEHPFLLVSSSGSAADHCSHMFGLYRKNVEMIEGRSVYIQEHDSKYGGSLKKLFSYKGVWRMTSGNTVYLKALTPSESPISAEWQYKEYNKKIWHNDLTFKVIGLNEEPSECEVTISLIEDIARDIKEPDLAGVYKASGSYCLGRPVLQHSEGGLTISVDWSWDGGCLEVGSGVGGAGYLWSGSAPSQCPADPRASSNERPGRAQTHWEYEDKQGGLTESGGISFTCNKHNATEGVSDPQLSPEDLRCQLEQPLSPTIFGHIKGLPTHRIKSVLREYKQNKEASEKKYSFGAAQVIPVIIEELRRRGIRSESP